MKWINIRHLNWLGTDDSARRAHMLLLQLRIRVFELHMLRLKILIVLSGNRILMMEIPYLTPRCKQQKEQSHGNRTENHLVKIIHNSPNITNGTKFIAEDKPLNCPCLWLRLDMCCVRVKLSIGRLGEWPAAAGGTGLCHLFGIAWQRGGSSKDTLSLR